MQNFSLFSLCRALCYPEQSRTSKAEKNRLKWKELNYSLSCEQPLPPIFSLLIDLYDGKEVYEQLESCRINPDYTSHGVLRNDLEFYIPQLSNFVVFHWDFAHGKLLQFFEQWSKVDLYFGHLYYWYINSLPKDTYQEQAEDIIENIIDESIDENNIHLFDNDYKRFFTGVRRKLSPADYETKLNNINSRRTHTAELIHDYKDNNPRFFSEIGGMKASDLELKPYISPFLQEDNVRVSNPFTSTLIFFQDLCFAAEDIVRKSDPLAYLKTLLDLINKALLPSYVYVPFVKESIRNYTVLNIAVDETKIFSTKERAPFYVCLEIFRPQKELAYEYTSMFHSKDTMKSEKEESFIKWAKKKLNIADGRPRTDIDKYNLFTAESREILEEEFKLSKLDEIVSLPKTLKYLRPSPNRSFVPLGDPNQSIAASSHNDKENYLQLLDPEQPAKPLNAPIVDMTLQNSKRSKRFLSEDILEMNLNHHKDKNKPNSETNISSMKSSFKNTSFRRSPPENYLPKLATEIDLLEVLPEEEKSKDLERESEQGRNGVQSSRVTSATEYFFGEDSTVQSERIRKQSPFGSLKTWRLVHMIIKSGADMKEEQFAIQLISKFEHIFKKENLKLPLSSYEILSLGENVGVIEVIKDAITISKLKEKMYSKNMTSLNEFFIKFYGTNVKSARKQFCRSLAAYSLVCYLLQIKDRHNGNIMLHKDGHIIHIDFGFFLSNSPGKGIEFERKIPFKLLNEYIEVLGDTKSKLFQKFRELFYKGFLAARQHREQILILVKMVYSSHSQNFPCFKAGMKAIQDLEKRFYPENASDKVLREYCDSLINQSLDNWRARCYDKYQYYFQGILY